MVFLAAAQLAAYLLVGLTVIPLYAIFDLDHMGVTLDDWAEERAQRLARESIACATDGCRVAPSPELPHYVERFPGFRIAAFDPADMTALEGSSPQLVATLSGLKKLRFKVTSFTVDADGGRRTNCSIRTLRRVDRVFLTAACGYAFTWEDSPFILRDFSDVFFLSANSLFYLPLIAASIVIAAFVVRRGLSPLREAAAAAARIDLESLGERLPEAQMPAEIMPLVSAINSLLARLDAGVARQRRFTANAAHELRTPIAIMRARADNPENDSLREDFRRSLRRMRTIAEQLLALARLNERQGLAFEEIDLAQATLATVADYMPLVIENGRRIEFEPPQQRTKVRADRRALESILSNLIDNALRSEPNGGVIVVRANGNGVVEVVDHGAGVAAAERELVFEPFWRKSDATPGTGLGLAIVKELVEAHHGKVWVEETPGGGATFAIALPTV